VALVPVHNRSGPWMTTARQTSSIAAAIPQVRRGDVLLVQPGSYGSFNLDKVCAFLRLPGRRVLPWDEQGQRSSRSSFVG
jgi:hypothetical protein